MEKKQTINIYKPDDKVEWIVSYNYTISNDTRILLCTYVRDYTIDPPQWSAHNIYYWSISGLKKLYKNNIQRLTNQLKYSDVLHWNWYEDIKESIDKSLTLFTNIQNGTYN